MTSDEIVSSWKNEDYRLSLSIDEQALLPENPAGLIELSDQELLGIDGGTSGAPCLISISVITLIVTVISYAVTESKYCPAA
jgi:mersacidin/lichenicidin family type 2 lantibiotic